tara:strand:- start:51 stop:452 length:402 start_codon:yes stop_codon:yes gene_type:complete
MTTDEIQIILDYAYPKIKEYYGKGMYNDYPPIKLHQDIYARLSGDEEARGEHSTTSKAQYDNETNTIYIYYPNMVNEEDVLRSLIHEYTHYRQNITTLSKKYHAMKYTYDTDPQEIEAHKTEKDWQLFTTSKQ